MKLEDYDPTCLKVTDILDEEHLIMNLLHVTNVLCQNLFKLFSEYSLYARPSQLQLNKNATPLMLSLINVELHLEFVKNLLPQNLRTSRNYRHVKAQMRQKLKEKKEIV